MAHKTTIAVLATVVGALAAASGGAQAAEVCPPGTPSGPYCTNESVLTTKQRSATASKDGVVDLIVHCSGKVNCTGTLEFDSSAHGASASAAGHATVYASVHYSVGYGKTATLKIGLNSAGRHALERTGRLTVTVVTISKGKRSVIGHLSIKEREKHGKERKKHGKHA